MRTDDDHGHGGHAAATAHGSISAGWSRTERRLLAAFVVLAVFLVVEVVAGLVTGSLALLSDAGHMLTDVLGLGMALAAIHLASRGRGATAPHVRPLPARDPRRPRQRRAAVRRGRLRARRGGPPLRRPARRRSAARCSSSPSLGLAVNLVAFALLREGAKESLNVEGAYLEVLADTLGSVGVIVGAVVHRASPAGPGSTRSSAPPSACGSCPAPGASAARRCASSCRRRPPGIDLDAHRAPTSPALAGVVDVHDLHVWTLTSEMEVASAHLMVGRRHRPPRRARPGPRRCSPTRYGIAHATLQVEPDDHTRLRRVAW